MTQKEEMKRLVKRFTTFLNYDSTSDERLHDPFNADRNKRVKKDAEKLAKIALEEIINHKKLLKEKINKMLIALNEAEAALHMLGGKKKPPTGFIPCEVAAYQIVSKAIKDQSLDEKIDELIKYDYENK